MTKIDIHMHVFKYKPLPHTGTKDCFMQPEELISLYNEMGIERGVLLPIVSPEHMNSVQGNEEIYHIVEEYPDRFNWFCNIDPRNGNNSKNADLVKNIEAFKAMGAKGIGEVTANLLFDDPLVYNLFSAAEKTNMPLLFHVAIKHGEGYGLIDNLGLPKLEKALQDFPKLKFIGHSQPFWAEIDASLTEENRNTYPEGKVKPGRVVELLRKYPNMYADLSAGSGFNAILRDEAFGYSFLEELQDKIFFGTDICAISERIGLSAYLDEALKNGKISDAVYKKVCFENAEKVLGIGHSPKIAP